MIKCFKTNEYDYLGCSTEGFPSGHPTIKKQIING